MGWIHMTTFKKALGTSVAALILVTTGATSATSSQDVNLYRDCRNGWDIGGTSEGSGYTTHRHYQNGKLYSTSSGYGRVDSRSFLNYGSINFATTGRFDSVATNCWA